MTTLEQAARQALETLERASDAGYSVECDETITALREALEQAAPKAAPVVAFKDARVQAVYDILVDDEAPPACEHWEGFIARRIVDALAALQQEAQEPVAIVVECGNLYAKVKLSREAFGTTKVGDRLYRTPTAPASLSEQDERRAFEQDFMRVLPGENLKRKFGHYEDPRTRHRWDGWKARAAIAAQGVKA